MSLNHYVSDFLLRNFSDSCGLLWILDKNTGKVWCKKASLKTRQSGYDAFAENGYNPVGVEDLLTKLETETAPIIKKIIADADKHKAVILSHHEKEWLCAFLLVQILRIPRVKNFATNRDWNVPQGRQLLWYMLKNICKHDLPSGLEVDIANPELKEHEHLDLIVWKRMTDMVVDVVQIDAHASSRFVIGDEPCLLKGWLTKSRDLVVMPLSKYLFIQLSMPEDSVGEYAQCDNQFVDAFNAQTYEKAQRFIAGCDRHCLTALWGTTK